MSMRVSASPSTCVLRAYASPSRTSRSISDRSLISLSFSTDSSAISARSFMRVMGVCRSWEMAARMRTRSSTNWAMRSRMALNATAAWATSLGPVSLMRGVVWFGSSVFAASASVASGRMACRTASQLHSTSRASCATIT
ncbi:hypothetical protein D3C86_1373450 [compost metagenome]